MSVCVCSEIGPLKRVLLHRPGKELEHLVPQELERLLFDDIPYLALARQEHDTFADILRSQGAEVLYLEDLAAEALAGDAGLRERFVRQFLREAGPVAQLHATELFALLMDIADPLELVLRTMSGVTVEELRPTMRSGPLSGLMSRPRQFVMDPIPNLYFTRDPFAVVGKGVSLNRMYSPTRRRETIYGEYILKHHPLFAGQTPLYYDREKPFHIEGGDILDLSESVLAIGVSQRTAPEAIEALAAALFADGNCAVRQILVLDIPSMRAYMHLDTVFTQVDRTVFTVHPDILPSLRVYDLRPGAGGALIANECTEKLETVLARALGADGVTLIHCGGQDGIASAREQWNDGSNTLCVAPGKVIVYNRNHVTNHILRSHGLEVFEMPSSELARGRGGPRCMSMPLLRLPVDTM